MWSVLVFLVGFGLAVSGGVTIISYMNFLPAGITWLEYFLFIKTRVECYFFPVGCIMMFFAIQRIPRKIE